MENQEGFRYRFDPEACKTCNGNCCRGSGGYIWVEMDELEDIAAFKNMNIDSFIEQYVRLVGTKLSLQERLIDDEYLCCFFDPVSILCTIYEVRPKQCQTFPFWDQFKKKPQLLLHECPGVRLK